MKIRVNEKWQIVSDSHSWMVQQHRGVRKGGGGDIWKTHYYCIDFASALESLSQHRLRISDAESAESIKLALGEIVSECKKAAEIFSEMVL